MPPYGVALTDGGDVRLLRRGDPCGRPRVGSGRGLRATAGRPYGEMSVRAVGDGVLDVPFVGSGRGAAGDS